MSRIDYWHTQMPYLETRRIAAKLREEGYMVGRKLVRSYMQEMGIYAVYPKPNLSKRDFKGSVVPYLLRNKEISFPNHAWCKSRPESATLPETSASGEKGYNKVAAKKDEPAASNSYGITRDTAYFRKGGDHK